MFYYVMCTEKFDFMWYALICPLKRGSNKRRKERKLEGRREGNDTKR
jgi:hypothetical protein